MSTPPAETRGDLSDSADTLTAMSTPAPTTTDTPAIEAIGLVKKFGDSVAVDDVSFSVPRGSVLGLLGPNGAGKTTTVRMMTTLTHPTSGTARSPGTTSSPNPTRSDARWASPGRPRPSTSCSPVARTSRWWVVSTGSAAATCVASPTSCSSSSPSPTPPTGR